jgi:hypothetical protein
MIGFFSLAVISCNTPDKDLVIKQISKIETTDKIINLLDSIYQKSFDEINAEYQAKYDSIKEEVNNPFTITNSLLRSMNKSFANKIVQNKFDEVKPQYENELSVNRDIIEEAKEASRHIISVDSLKSGTPEGISIDSFFISMKITNNKEGEIINFINKYHQEKPVLSKFVEEGDNAWSVKDLNTGRQFLVTKSENDKILVKAM